MNYIKLDKIVTISSGQNAPQDQNEYCLDGCTFIKVSNLDDIIKDDDESRACKITVEAISNNKLKVVPKKSILFAKSGLSCVKNRVYLTKKETYVVNHLCILSNIIDSYAPKWLLYFIKSFNVTKLIKDESYPSISLRDIKNINVPIISKEEQQIIIKNLDYINSLIKNKQKEFSLLDELIKSRFIEMFVNSEFDKIQIRKLVDTKKISAKKMYKSHDEIKYIDISSIDNQSNLIVGNTKYIFEKAPSRAQQCLKKNDILISTVRPNLKNIAIFTEDGDGFVGSSGFCVLRATECNYQYLKYVVLNDDFTNAMIKLTNGANYPAVRDDDVLNYETYNAPIELQNEFASFAEQIDKLKFNVQKEIKDLQELLDKKMQEYFSE